ncbi:MAG TPA: HlyD family type I secretion periplasmic adaptor subunit [Geminicoccaceae bacterium]|nr:HlyD family type I secretion periplasmic adaptor subunit [Geminicoccaceae bacterium]
MDALLEPVLAWSARLGVPLSEGQTSALAVALSVLLLLSLVAVGRARRRAHVGETGSVPLARLVRGPKVMGYAALLIFFGGFGAWAAIAPLAGAAIAPGVVSPDGSRKTVEHLEGGIVRAIHVREGDRVRAGQVLVTLEDVSARAEFEELRERLVHLVTVEARLLAEQAGADSVAAPEALDGIDPAIVEPALTAQNRLLASRRATLKGREQIFNQRILQLEAEIDGLHEMIAAQDEQLALLAQEVEGVQTLYDKGLAPLPKLLELKRTQADVRAGRAANRAQIARHQQSIGETRLEVLTMHELMQEQIAKELSEVRTELAAVRSQLPSREDVLTRTAVTAPLAGTVMNVRVTTATGVVDPGQPLLDLVPDDARLVIDARVKPTDMDTVHAGQRARVLFPAYGQRNLPQIFGQLRSVSADRLLDDRTGEPYFLAKVEIAPDELARLAPDIALSPGMPADVMILTGERTLLDYLIRPFVQSLTKSFRET